MSGVNLHVTCFTIEIKLIYINERLKSFSTVPAGLPDMWLFHVDHIHFDLIIAKDSYLAKEGSIESKTK